MKKHKIFGIFTFILAAILISQSSFGQEKFKKSPEELQPGNPGWCFKRQQGDDKRIEKGTDEIFEVWYWYQAFGCIQYRADRKVEQVQREQETETHAEKEKQKR